MKALNCNLTMLTSLLLSILFSLSCSNDTDLLVDAILDHNLTDEGAVVNDYFSVSSNEIAILNVLSNDKYLHADNVRITEISSPKFGAVEINENGTSITYIPQDTSQENPEVESDTLEEVQLGNQVQEPVTENETSESTEEPSETIDTFTYTTELVDENETTTEVGTVQVVLESSEESNTTQQFENNGSTADNQNGESENNTTNSANLLFSSGFEGIILSDPNEGYQYLSGTDNVTGFSWPMQILGSDFSGIHRVNDGGGAAITNRIENTSGPDGTETAALFQQVNYDVQVTQTPYQINNIKENPKELYMRYWMKTDDTSVTGPNKWRAIWEYKTDDYATKKDGFRMIAFMATDYEGKPYWLFQGDTSPQDPVWQAENTTVPVLMNEWFQVEYHIKWSDGGDGYASMKVNGQLIGEHYGATTSNSDDLDFIMLTQVYGNSHPMHQWVDDIEIWDGLPD